LINIALKFDTTIKFLIIFKLKSLLCLVWLTDSNGIHSKLKHDTNGGIDAASGSGLQSTAPTTKAIGSLAKKQADVTRQGTQKLKFVPTLPARRKKE